MAGRIAGIRGHGPKLPNGKRQLRGMLDGGNIAWLTKTYKQSKVVWRKLLRAFGPLEGTVVRIDREERRIEMLANNGALAVWSGHTRDAIDNLRGDAFDGVLLDEAAYFDLGYALDEVIEPALLDRPGCWVFVFSSPNAGWDKNEERETPSYFNRLCKRILEDEERSWAHWHNRTEDNPRLDPVALAKLRERLGPESVTAQQELDALLVAGGLLALKIDREKVLLSANATRPPSYWRMYGAFDWGYSHPWSFGLFAVDEDGDRYLVDSATGRRQTPDEIGKAVLELLKRWGLTFQSLPFTAAGHDCWHDKGKQSGENTPTFAQKVMAQHGWALKRANIARVAGLNNMRDYLALDKFHVYRTRGNLETLSVLETRITDPDDPEDVLKQDANLDGHGGDDPYDMARYGLAEGMLSPSKPVVPRSQERSGGVAELVKGKATPVRNPGWRPQQAATPSGKVVSPTFRPGVTKR